MTRSAAILTVGTELVEGLRVDTNTSVIARRVSSFGFQVRESVSVGDGLEEITAALSRLISRYDAIFVTGGLGPTHDDVTRQALSRATGLELVVDQGMVSFLRDFTRSHGAVAPSSEFFAQASVLEGAEVLSPVSGTAPGQVIGLAGTTLVALPGPPREMTPLLDEYLMRFGESRPAFIDIGLTGLSESQACDLVVPVLPEEGLEFTVLARPGDVHVILTDRGAGDRTLAFAAEEAKRMLGDRWYSDDGRTLAAVVLDAAKERGWTIGCVESCTGGLISSSLTGPPGSSAAFAGGLVTYSNHLKVSLAGVREQALADHGAVSSEVAYEMAEGGRHVLGCDVVVSATGVAGPAGGSADKPVGTVWFGLSSPFGTFTQSRCFSGSRDVVRERVVAHALDLVRLELGRN